MPEIRFDAKEVTVEDATRKISTSSEKSGSIQGDAVWISIFCAVANSSETNVQKAIVWADEGLEAFRSRF